MGCESTKNTYVDNTLLDDLLEKSNFVNHEPIQEFHRMERLWRLYCPGPQVWHCNQQDPPVFYLCFNTHDGFACYYLPGACFLEKHQKVYMGGKKESLVLPIKIKAANSYSLYLTKNRNAYLIVSRSIAPFFPFEPYFFSASFPSTKVIR